MSKVLSDAIVSYGAVRKLVVVAGRAPPIYVRFRAAAYATAIVIRMYSKVTGDEPLRD